MSDSNLAKHKLTYDEAKNLTARINQTLSDLLVLIIEAFDGAADQALGYTSWEAYVTAEFPNIPRFDRIERRDAVKQLSDAGMSTREVGATLGVSHSTVENDLPGQNLPERSTLPVPPQPDPPPQWTPEEKNMRKAISAGHTVVGSLRDHHARVVEWALENERAVRIDRRTAWGNPFELPDDGDRETVIQNYAQHYLPYKPKLCAALPQLRGKLLLCWCAPEACHGDVLKHWAEQ